MGMFTIIFIVSGCLLVLLMLILFIWFFCNNNEQPNFNSHCEDVENQREEAEMHQFDIFGGSRYLTTKLSEVLLISFFSQGDRFSSETLQQPEREREVWREKK